MAYDLKHTGEAVDAAVSAVESGEVVTNNTVSSIAPGEAKPASADAIAKELQKKVDNVEGKGLSTNDYTNSEKAIVNSVRDGSAITKHANKVAEIIDSNTISTLDYASKKALNSESVEPIAIPVSNLLSGKDALKVGVIEVGVTPSGFYANTGQNLYSTLFVDVNQGDVIIARMMSYSLFNAFSKHEGDDITKGYTKIQSGLSSSFEMRDYMYIAGESFRMAICYANDSAYAPAIHIVSYKYLAEVLNQKFIRPGQFTPLENIQHAQSNCIDVLAEGNTTNDHAISMYGELTASSGYATTEINLPKGSLIIAKLLCFSGFASLSTVKEGVYTPVYRGDNIESIYEYITEEDTRIALTYVPKGSGHFDTTPTVYASTPSSFNGMLLKEVDKAMQISTSDKRKGLAYLANDGENLYYAIKVSDSIEMVYHFKKCMANNLYTFYTVGWRTNNGSVSLDTESPMYGVTVINQTGSDNIGPLSVMYDNKWYWIGGNHSYPNESSSVKYRTAQTDSFKIYTDGIKLNAGELIFCENLQVVVRNTLFDPSVSPSEGDVSLSTPLASEVVCYHVVGNSISVNVSHSFSDDTPCLINLYYGMQSMFTGESGIITPNGAYVNWSLNDTMEFHKDAYPKFNRFIEKGQANGYQSTYLIPFGLGSHKHISDSSPIFSRSNGKGYHHMLSYNNIELAGAKVEWGGTYTFFKDPIVDNEDVLVYDGMVFGKKTLFISSKRAFNGYVPVPSNMFATQVRVVENVGFTNADGETEIDFVGANIYISCVAPSSLIIEEK